MTLSMLKYFTILQFQLYVQKFNNYLRLLNIIQFSLNKCFQRVHLFPNPLLFELLTQLNELLLLNFLIQIKS